MEGADGMEKDGGMVIVEVAGRMVVSGRSSRPSVLH